MNDDLNIILALKESIEKENWYAALFVALTIPDIFGKIDEPRNNNVGARYIKWYNSYVKTKSSFLSGPNCYALRCAVLHEGKQDISEQRAKDLDDVLNGFDFVIVPPGITIHNNRRGDKLQLQVSEICKEMLYAAETYIKTNCANIKNELVIRKIDFSKGGIIF